MVELTNANKAGKCYVSSNNQIFQQNYGVGDPGDGRSFDLALAPIYTTPANTPTVETVIIDDQGICFANSACTTTDQAVYAWTNSSDPDSIQVSLNVSLANGGCIQGRVGN